MVINLTLFQFFCGGKCVIYIIIYTQNHMFPEFFGEIHEQSRKMLGSKEFTNQLCLPIELPASTVGHGCFAVHLPGKTKVGVPKSTKLHVDISDILYIYTKSGYLDQLHNCPFASLSASVKYILEQNQINRNKCY